MKICFLCLVLFPVFQVGAQGVYTDFGQNRVQNVQQNFSTFSSDEIEVMFTPEGRELGDYVLQYAKSVLPDMETTLDYRLGGGIKIIVFHNLSAYRQSNIGLTNPQFNAGGYTYIFNNTATVYFNGSHIDLEKQVRKALAEVLINEKIFGGNIQERVRTAALLNLPNWYYKGLVSYLSENWSVENDNLLKDAYQTKRLKAFTSLEDEDVVLAGHAIWRFIEERYGKGSVSDIVFYTRFTRNVESAINYYTALDINTLFNNCEDYYKKKFEKDENFFSDPRGSENAPARISKFRHTQFKISPDGNQLAIVTNVKGLYSIWIYNIRLKTLMRLKKGGYKTLNQTIDYSFPILAWDTKGKKLAVLANNKGKNIIEEYDLKGKLKKKIPLEEFDWVKEFSYNSDGSSILFSAAKNGRTDLFTYDISSKEYVRLTNDIYDNLDPRYTEKNDGILFTSNKPVDAVDDDPLFVKNPTTNIYIYDIKTKMTKPLTPGQSLVNYFQPIDMGNGYYTFLSDKNGVVNSYAVAYNYNINAGSDGIVPLTNYKRSIIYHDISVSAGLVADLVVSNGRYGVYISELTSDPVADASISKIYNETAYRQSISMLAVKKMNIISKDSSNSQTDTIITHIKDTVVVVLPKKYGFQTGFPETPEVEEDEPVLTENINNPDVDALPYSNQFSVDYFLTQLDNSILNNYYFMNGPVDETVFNQPFFTPLLKTSISDLLKNHTIEIGARVPLAFNYSEYFFNYTNRKRRVDKELNVFRKTRLIDKESYVSRMITSQGSYTFSFPFNERSRIQAGVFARQDKYVITTVDSGTLNAPDFGNVYGGIQAAYIYDNTISKGLNLFQGLRFKIFGEYYNGFQKTASVINLGVDIRNYQRVHRQIILANRFTFNTSPGAQKTAYYLGGVENWLTPDFNKDIPLLKGNDYVFQTIAPLRGFARNARNGNSYVMFSTELRIPIISYLYQKPIKALFFRNLMVAPFLDLGTAWVGKSPYDIGNPFNTRIIDQPSYTATVISQRNPFLAGMGFGVRSRILGYYVKFDQAWGLLESKFGKSQQLFSMGLDF
ncbi:MAG: hypothetical protein H7321_01275 [Bacteroidia bacterium]|nr:hypothetical protein [Bacteroidia bacterium]